jgi:hypothetical protein
MVPPPGAPVAVLPEEELPADDVDDVVLVPLEPESLSDVAVILPFELPAPWTTTESPGLTDRLDTPRLLVILVAELSSTLTVLPEASVT